jgi:hypothetical protein
MGSEDEDETKPVSRVAVEQAAHFKHATAEAQSAKHEKEDEGQDKGKSRKQGGKPGKGKGAKARAGVDVKATVVEAASKAVKETTDNVKEAVEVRMDRIVIAL